MMPSEKAGLMRALVCEACGQPGRLSVRSVPRPTFGASDVLIDVHAATVNFADTLMIAGTYQTKTAPPFIPGLEAAGVIETAPRGAVARPGDRVVATLWHGGFAEVARAAASETFVIPGRMSFEIAATLPSTYASAGLALTDVARLGPGETLLVHGAGGGAGLAAIEIGKAIGARVIAVASTQHKQALARAAGADNVLSSGAADWPDTVRALTGERGVEVCFDPVGGAIVDPSLSALGWGGRYIVFGFASGDVPPIQANRLLVKNRAMLGTSLRHYRLHRPDRLEAMMARLFAWWEVGVIRPAITASFPLDQTATALDDLAGRRARGKIIIYPKASA